jgi:hypothetical protein
MRVENTANLQNTANLRDFYSSLNLILVMKSRRTRWMEHMACIGENKNTYKILMGKPEGKRLLRRPGLKWEDNIKVDRIAVGLEVLDRINLVPDSDEWQAAVKIIVNRRIL